MGGKQSQFEKLLLPHLDGAYNVAYWLIQKDADAQAIVQEAFAQAWQEFGKLRETEVRVWLLVIVLRIAHSWIRAQANQSKVVSFAPSSDDFGAPEAMSDAKVLPEVVGKESARNLYGALSSLPVEFREILVLHEVEGWTYRQLAAALEITRDTVLTRLSLAHSSLRRGLRDAREKLDSG